MTERVWLYALSKPSESEGVGSVALDMASHWNGKNAKWVYPGKWRSWLYYSFTSPIWFAWKAFREKPARVVCHTTEASFDPVVARSLLRWIGLDYSVTVIAHGATKPYWSAYDKEVRLGNAFFHPVFWFSLMVSDARSRCVNRAEEIYCVSRIVQKELKQYYGASSKVLHNGISARYVKESPKRVRKKLNAILWVGNLHWLKGLYYLILANQIVGKKIVAVGLNPEHVKELEKVVDCSRVKFIGRVQRKELHEFYDQSDLLCVPSVYESFGLVYLEALSHGLPAIGCKGTGAEEILLDGKNGYLVQKGSVPELVRAIRKAEKNISKLSRNAFVEKRFYWENILPKR